MRYQKNCRSRCTVAPTVKFYEKRKSVKLKSFNRSTPGTIRQRKVNRGRVFTVLSSVSTEQQCVSDSRPGYNIKGRIENNNITKYRL